MPSRKTPVLVGAMLIAVALSASCSRGKAPVAVETSAESPRPAATDTTTVAPVSDDDQVREAVMAFQDAYNTQNWDAYLELMCPAWRAQYTGPVMDSTKKTRVDQGLTTITVTSVRIVGDEATATLDAQNEMLGRKTIDFNLVREDGWRVCMPDGVQ
ncbi:MAG TPA: nuclear transport factor 2 family protein [Mycobacterium sp.]